MCGVDDSGQSFGVHDGSCGTAALPAVLLPTLSARLPETLDTSLTVLQSPRSFSSRALGFGASGFVKTYKREVVVTLGVLFSVWGLCVRVDELVSVVCAAGSGSSVGTSDGLRQ